MGVGRGEEKSQEAAVVGRDGTMLDADTAPTPAETRYVSTGHLPSSEQVQQWVDEAHHRYASVSDGRNADVYPALEHVPSELFGVCAVGTSGSVYAAGDTEHPFTIMVRRSRSSSRSSAKLSDLSRRLLGVNATGMPFNSPPLSSAAPMVGRTRW